jgi:hypothetical protein
MAAMLSVPEELLIGYIAGLFGKLITSPLTVITVRLQTENEHEDEEEQEQEESLDEKGSASFNIDHKTRTLPNVVKSIYSEYGIAGFWKGKYRIRPLSR